MVVVQMPDVSAKVKPNGEISLDFLMPNGILIPMSVDFYCSTFEKIKQDLWLESVNFPLYNLLRHCDTYTFLFVNSRGQKEEVLSESQSLSEIKPSVTFLKLIEKEPNSERCYSFDRRITSLIGAPIVDLTDYQSLEVSDFKLRIKYETEKIIQERDLMGWEERMRYLYPLRLINDQLLNKISLKLKHGSGCIDVCREQKSFKEIVDMNSTPKSLIIHLLKKFSNLWKLPDTDPSNFMLKVKGYEEYLYGDYCLLHFKYIYECLQKDIIPSIFLVTRSEIVIPAPVVPPHRRLAPPLLSPSPSRVGSQKSSIYSWNISSNVNIFVKSVSQVQTTESRVKLVTGLYHGPDILCAAAKTEETLLYDQSCTWNSNLNFDHLIKDLPEMTRVCFMLMAVGGVKKKQKDTTPLAWVNISLFDFRSQLRQGEYELYMWSVTEDESIPEEESCFPIGTVTPNPAGKNATTLTIGFPSYNAKEKIIYPPKEVVLECAARNMEPEGTLGSPMWRSNKIVMDQLSTILQQGPVNQMFEQDKELVWRLRHEVQHHYPESLALLLSSVKWSNYIDVAKLQALLISWPRLNCELSLALLDFTYADKAVREFAVNCLEQLPDDEVTQYLLQLVQVLKFEMYLYCPLVKFLLTRALRNRRFGHKLFWLLKSDMHDRQMNLRFSLILEVYCKSSQDHTTDLIKQNEALLKIDAANMLIKNSTLALNDRKNKENLSADLRKVLCQNAYSMALSNLHSPLNPLWNLKKLLVQKCKFLDSKMRPLWLVWENEELKENECHFSIIYKNGDDLRQDMLILQVIQIVDFIWQEEGLDLRLNPYGCICTGRNTGMIEAVDAQTIANIQRKFDKASNRCVYEWLKEMNPKKENLDKAVEEFTLSCAGYSVITYVLGICDRHNDNIMIKKNGQLFHIDFGHILGNTKKKFGVVRDRVPFVLTNHFVTVIKNGEKPNDNFQRFQEICEKAYMTLRRRGTILITLFRLMIQSGLPELSSEKHVEYLQKSLALGVSDEEAIQQFNAKFKESLNKCWTTSLNWWFHMRVVDNT